MQMKAHILAALREQLDSWENLLVSLSPVQRSIPLQPSDWTPQDVIAHLWAWQQRTSARFAAALAGREPEFPHWPVAGDPDGSGSPDAVNAWIYTANRQRPWAAVYQDWQTGFQGLLDMAAQVAEKDLLDADKYPWMEGSPLALVLLGTYDHHQEHIEALQAWLHAHGAEPEVG
ncbi:MAG: ClbS/DfsB family four-helix bundle protein [Chloroflexi bacterium]|nr:ClbS/DfsB family four-helix bundle protein [Chloroflexota bacterium]